VSMMRWKLRRVVFVVVVMLWSSALLLDAWLYGLGSTVRFVC
jgi:hypothetical protein